MSSASQIGSRPPLRRMFEDAGPGLSGSRRKVAPRRRPGSCLLLRATPLCANEEITCSATATGLSFLRHSDLIALVCPVTWPLQNYLWAGSTDWPGLYVARDGRRRALPSPRKQERLHGVRLSPQLRRRTSRSAMTARRKQRPFVENLPTLSIRPAILARGEEEKGDLLSALYEPISEAIGLALDRGIEHLNGVRIILVREHGAFRVQYEAGRLHLLANIRRLDPMQRLGVARARSDGGGVVHDDVESTGLQPLVDGSIEPGRRRALGLDQRGVEIVIEQVQPQDIRCLRGPRHRHEIRRDGFDVLSVWLLRKHPYAADRVVLEVGDFGRHEAADPSFRSHDVGEETGPIAVAWVNVDDDGARIDSCKPDPLG